MSTAIFLLHASSGSCWTKLEIFLGLVGLQIGMANVMLNCAAWNQPSFVAWKSNVAIEVKSNWLQVIVKLYIAINPVLLIWLSYVERDSHENTNNILDLSEIEDYMWETFPEFENEHITTTEDVVYTNTYDKVTSEEMPPKQFTNRQLESIFELDEDDSPQLPVHLHSNSTTYISPIRIVEAEVHSPPPEHVIGGKEYRTTTV